MSELLAKGVLLGAVLPVGETCQGLDGICPSLSEFPPVDSFSRPQPGGVGGPLLEKARLGQLTPEHLDQVRLQLDRLHQSLVDEMEDDSAEVENFREGILDALGDAFTLLNYGLDEFSRFLEQADPAYLRLGRLLLEKGEQEFLGLQRELRRVERAAHPGERTVNLWGQLLELARSPDQDQDQEFLETMAWAKSAVEAHLDGTLRDFLGAVECLPGDPEEAQRKMAVSLIRFREFFGLSI